jgi:predicted ArsR family transcriptional regulator
MKSTREKVLQAISAHPRSSIVQIAHEVGINTISVRHHLTSLQASGLVVAEEERHGVGRPHMVYLLTEKGMEFFPTSYLRLTNHLLDQLKETISTDQINDLFKKMGDRIAENYKTSFSELNMEERLELLKQVMEKEGFVVQWEKKDDHYEIREIACPFFIIGKKHPEVCIFDKTLIANLLSIPPEKIKTTHVSDALCTFTIWRNS